VEKTQSGKKKTGRRMVLFAVLAAAALILFFGIGSAVTLYGPYTEVRHLENDLRQAKAAIDSLNREIHSLKTDTAYMERIARERLGMARKDEKIYKFVGEK
jgi:cell division protein FtsB